MTTPSAKRARRWPASSAHASSTPPSWPAASTRSTTPATARAPRTRRRGPCGRRSSSAAGSSSSRPEHALEQQDERVDESRVRATDAARQHEIITRLEQRRRAEHARAVEHAQEAELGEIATSAYVRNQKAARMSLEAAVARIDEIRTMLSPARRPRAPDWPWPHACGARQLRVRRRARRPRSTPARRPSRRTTSRRAGDGTTTTEIAGVVRARGRRPGARPRDRRPRVGLQPERHQLGRRAGAHAAHARRRRGASA